MILNKCQGVQDQLRHRVQVEAELQEVPLREVPRSRNEAKLGGLLFVVVVIVIVVVVAVIITLSRSVECVNLLH